MADLDGTLLCGEQQMSDYTRQTLALAAARGIEFVPATGRLFSGLPQAVKTLPFLRYAILSNGAQIYDCVDSKVLRRAELTAEEADRVFAYLQRLPVTLDCYMQGVGYMDQRFYDCLDDWVLDPIARQLVRKNRRPVPALREYIRAQGKPVQRIQAFFRDLELRRAVFASLPRELPGVAVACSQPGNLEITQAGATKGEGLKFLCQFLGVSPTQVMAFGDERNDSSMLAAAGVGVAMGNAAPEVKAAADLVTDSNLEDGVARTIRRLVLGIGE